MDHYLFCVLDQVAAVLWGGGVRVCATQLVWKNPFGMLWVRLRGRHFDHSLLRSGLKPPSRSQEWTVSIAFSRFPINPEEVTLNKQRCVFCSVVYRNMVLPSFSHGIHCSGEILFCINRTFSNQKFCTEESIWELKLNLASGLTNRIFSTLRF